MNSNRLVVELERGSVLPVDGGLGARVSCLACEFLRQVRQDTGDAFHLLRPGQAYRAATKATDDSRRRRGSEP